MFRTAAITRTAAVAATLLAAGTAAASGSVQIKGTVPLACSVSVSDLAQSLNLAGGESNRTVGTVVETCNSGTGYTILLTSQNGGSLRSTANGTVPVGYTLSYDNAGGDLKNQFVVTRSGAQFNKAASLAVSIPANAQAIAGSYADTVTITIAAK